MFDVITSHVRALWSRNSAQRFDDAARARGWLVERRSFGRRVYRDPMFPRAIAVPARPIELVDLVGKGEGP